MGICILFSCQSNLQEEKKLKSVYNAELAEKLKADQYGMSKYVMAFLKRGPIRSQDSITAAKLQKAHLENIGRLVKEGKLVLAGPFFDDGEIRGIYIFDVETIEEAKALTETDPAIKAGRLVMELHPWYGTAALKQVNELHKTIQQQNITEQ
jgi:uncharacterized protein YciI